MSIIVKGINYSFQIGSFETVTLNLIICFRILFIGLCVDGVNSSLKFRNAVSW